MSVQILKNKELTLTINSLGAELTGITDHTANREYLWNGNPAFWKRRSPVLFPIVGSLKNQSYRYNGKVYTLPQHGFARDLEFKLLRYTDSEIWYRLDRTEETRKVYPFEFALEAGYRLTDRRITVMWKVINLGTDDMFFSIGGHPAFLCALKEDRQQSDYYIAFDKNAPVHYLLVNEKGLAVKKPFEEQAVLHTDNGFLKIDPRLFDRDALIIENDQFHRVSLADSEKKPYVTVEFDAPLFGLWSPAGKNAPFICIEPWYGRCDSSDFNGSFEEKEWGNHLKAGKQFETAYTIDIA